MFEEYIGLELDEFELFKLIRSDIHKDLSRFGDKSYCLSLEHKENRKVAVSHIQYFLPGKFTDYLYSQKYSPRAILFRMDGENGKLVLVGYYNCADSRLFPDGTIKHHGESYKKIHQPFPMPPRDLIEKGFAAIQGHLANSTRRKPE